MRNSILGLERGAYEDELRRKGIKPEEPEAEQPPSPEKEKGLELERVIANLRLKRDHPEQAKHIRPLLLILGGGNKAVMSAGAALALKEMGYDGVFDTVVGTSAGALVGGMFLGDKEQAYRSYQLYPEEGCSKEFIDFGRKRKQVDVDFILDKLKTGEKRLDVEGIMESPTRFYVGAATKTGHLELMNAKTTKPDIFTALKATTAMPLFYNEEVEIGGERYFDSPNDWVPIEQCIKQFKPTDILILPNRSEKALKHLGEQAVSSLVSLAKIPPIDVAKEFIDNPGNRRELDAAKNSWFTRVGILYPPDEVSEQVSTLTQDPQTLLNAGKRAAIDTLRKFGEPHTDLKI